MHSQSHTRTATVRAFVTACMCRVRSNLASWKFRPPFYMTIVASLIRRLHQRMQHTMQTV